MNLLTAIAFIVVICLSSAFATSKTSFAASRRPGTAIRRRPSNRTQIETRIIGGYVTTPGEFAHMVRIKSRFPNGRGASCGASIWNKNSIVTASHCLFMCPGAIKANLVEACIGDYDTSVRGDGEQCYTTSTILTHEGYRACDNSNWFQNDIAVLKFSSPLNVPVKGNERGLGKTSFVGAPIQLQDGAPLIITGWGTTDPNPINPNPAIPSKLMAVKLKYLSTQSCKKYWNGIGGGQICGEGTYGHDACRGDSGGPLVYKDGDKYRLIGLTSFGTSQCATGTPAVYTSVYHFKSWVEGKAGPIGTSTRFP